MAHALTNNWVSLGIWYPMKLVSWRAFRGIRKGIGACNRRVSFMMACRYGSLSIELSSSFWFGPMTEASSSLARTILSGHRSNSVKAHSIVLLVVSEPARNISCIVLVES
ncbi:hypothetical protein Hanom_Chr13g01224411 [Helianthus anomalus]